MRIRVDDDNATNAPYTGSSFSTAYGRCMLAPRGKLRQFEAVVLRVSTIKWILLVVSVPLLFFASREQYKIQSELSSISDLESEMKRSFIVNALDSAKFPRGASTGAMTQQVRDSASREFTLQSKRALESIAWLELFKVILGACMVTGSIGILQSLMQKDLDDSERRAKSLLLDGLIRVLDPQEFKTLVTELVSVARSEIVAIGMGNSYLVDDALLSQIRSRAEHQKKLRLTILTADPRCAALRDRVREEGAYARYTGIRPDSDWPLNYVAKFKEAFSPRIAPKVQDRVTIDHSKFFVMSGILIIDDAWFFQPIGTPRQLGSLSPWFQVDRNKVDGRITKFFSTYVESFSTSEQDDPQMKLILLRHGESEANVKKELCGQLWDAPLTQLGASQIENLIDRHLLQKRPDKIVSGSHTRTARSAQLISNALDCALFLDDGVNERNFGPFEGVSFDQLAISRNVDPAMHIHELTTSWSDTEGVESDAALTLRAESVLSKHWIAGRVCVVTSANVIDALLRKHCETEAGNLKSIRTASGVSVLISRDFKWSKPKRFGDR